MYDVGLHKLHNTSAKCINTFTIDGADAAADSSAGVERVAWTHNMFHVVTAATDGHLRV